MDDQEELPSGFRPQTSGLSKFASLVEQAPDEIVTFLRKHPRACRKALMQSYNKRYMPSTFIEEAGDRFCVGWFDGERKCLRFFADSAEAVTDYLLFSFGKGRLPLNSSLGYLRHVPNDEGRVNTSKSGTKKKPWWKFWKQSPS